MSEFPALDRIRRQGKGRRVCLGDNPKKVKRIKNIIEYMKLKQKWTEAKVGKI